MVSTPARMASGLPPKVLPWLPGCSTVSARGAATTAPTGTPEPVAARLHQALSEVLQEAEVRQRLSDLGAQPMASTPAEFAAFLQKEDAKWGEVVRKGAIVLD